MKEFFDKHKQLITQKLELFLYEKGREYGAIHAVGAEMCDKIHSFAARGKMIRGGLVSLSALLYGNSEKEAAITVGAAMELFQSALLVHDDIMDHDLIRRGNETVFYQYQQSAQKNGSNDPEHTGEALGICAGDCTFFLAFELLSKLENNISVKLTKLFSKELGYVGVAQMLDVLWGSKNSMVSEEEIMKLYLYKTGRYTFSLPLSAGALLAKASEKEMKKLEKMGELLGIIFQIKDDELGLYGDENELGKPVGSDLVEGKKTLFLFYLLQSVSKKNKDAIITIIGNNKISRENIEFIQSLADEAKVNDRLYIKINNLAEQARHLITNLDVKESEYIPVLLALLDYSVNRIK